MQSMQAYCVFILLANTFTSDDLFVCISAGSRQVWCRSGAASVALHWHAGYRTDQTSRLQLPTNVWGFV